MSFLKDKWDINAFLKPFKTEKEICGSKATHRSCRSCKRQAEQHEEGDHLLIGLHVGHGECPVIALEAHLGRLEEICQLQKIESHNGGSHDW